MSAILNKLKGGDLRSKVAQMFSYLELDNTEKELIVDLLFSWLEDSSSNIVRVNSMQTIRRASGKPEKGEQLEVYLQPERAKGMTVRPRILTAEPGRELRWRGHLLIPGLFDDEHIFIIEPIAAGGVRFIQREIFTGLFVPLFVRRLDTETRRGFEDMNHVLKLRVEGE
jgi:hypothetical protein